MRLGMLFPWTTRLLFQECSLVLFGNVVYEEGVWLAVLPGERWVFVGGGYCHRCHSHYLSRCGGQCLCYGLVVRFVPDIEVEGAC